MTVELADVGDAATLVARALDVRAMIGTDSDYAALVQRYRIDDYFRETVDTICLGLGLVALGAVDQGLIVVPEADSVFSMGGVDAFESGLTPAQRVVSGLVHLAIAAIAYPRPEDLERSGIVRVRLSQVERVLRDTARTVTEHADEHDESLVRALGALEGMPPRRPGGQRRSRQTSLGLIGLAFDRLVEHGCARRVRVSDDDAEYQLLDRYRLQVQDLAVIDAYDVLRDAVDVDEPDDAGAAGNGPDSDSGETVEPGETEAAQ